MNKFLKIGQSKPDFIIDTALYSIINISVSLNSTTSKLDLHKSLTSTNISTIFKFKMLKIRLKYFKTPIYFGQLVKRFSSSYAKNYFHLININVTSPLSFDEKLLNWMRNFFQSNKHIYIMYILCIRKISHSYSYANPYPLYIH